MEIVIVIVIIIFIAYLCEGGRNSTSYSYYSNTMRSSDNIIKALNSSIDIWKEKGNNIMALLAISIIYYYKNEYKIASRGHSSESEFWKSQSPNYKKSEKPKKEKEQTKKIDWKYVLRGIDDIKTLSTGYSSTFQCGNMFINFVDQDDRILWKIYFSSSDSSEDRFERISDICRYYDINFKTEYEKLSRKNELEKETVKKSFKWYYKFLRERELKKNELTQEETEKVNKFLKSIFLSGQLSHYMEAGSIMKTAKLINSLLPAKTI